MDTCLKDKSAWTQISQGRKSRGDTQGSGFIPLKAIRQLSYESSNQIFEQGGNANHWEEDCCLSGYTKCLWANLVCHVWQFIEALLLFIVISFLASVSLSTTFSLTFTHHFSLIHSTQFRHCSVVSLWTSSSLQTYKCCPACSHKYGLLLSVFCCVSLNIKCAFLMQSVTVLFCFF